MMPHRLTMVWEKVFPSVGQLRDQGTARSPPKPGDCKAAGSGGNEVTKGHGTHPEEWLHVGVSPADHPAALTPPELPEDSNLSHLLCGLVTVQWKLPGCFSKS